MCFQSGDKSRIGDSLDSGSGENGENSRENGEKYSCDTGSIAVTT
jgi:hypothetical protein